MATSHLEQYRIADFVDWNETKQLVLNPKFQRRSVWTPAAKTFLIDTILRSYSVPKVYVRTKIDLKTKKPLREVVDGQQRLRALIDYASDGFSLSSRAKEFAGMKYSDLPPDFQEKFLSYPLAVEQLINASDSDVLEVFARLNSYTVRLNAAELRHAEFQGPFKWAVHDAAKRWGVLWEQYEIVTVRERVRMEDDSLMSEMLGIVLEGVQDGGQPKINSLYKRWDTISEEKLLELENAVVKLDTVLEFATSQLGELLSAKTPLSSGPHFLMFFAALAHQIVGIPEGALAAPNFPTSPQSEPDTNDALEALTVLAEVLAGALQPSEKLLDFFEASRASTQRISSRRRRFPVYVQAIEGQLVQ